MRFATHDMSVVDTPDPQRGGSEQGMISALGGLESILAAAERVRNIAARGGAGGTGGGGRGSSGRSRSRSTAGPGDEQYEGYFDRFSTTTVAEPEPEVDAVGDETPAADEVEGAVEPKYVAAVCDASAGNQAHCADGGNGSPAAAAAAAVTPRKHGDADTTLTAEAKSVRDDLSKFVAVLDEIASSEAAPEEVTLAGGWGPEHSNAAAFYAKELALLCGGGSKPSGGGAEASSLTAGGEARVVGSHLRVRYLDVLSCLVRYNLKVRDRCVVHV